MTKSNMTTGAPQLNASIRPVSLCGKAAGDSHLRIFHRPSTSSLLKQPVVSIFSFFWE
jgi:hypothetical protein